MPEYGGSSFSPERYAQTPRVREIPEHVPVEGFGEREGFIRDLVEGVGLPLNNVSEIRYEISSGNAVGSVHLESGLLTFYKQLEGLPEIAQMGVAVHELAHENDPHRLENARLYGSLKQMESTAANVATLAEQTKSTDVYLNWYHKHLRQELKAGNIDDKRFLRETHAIMLELRFTNPKHLQEVLHAQNPETADGIYSQLNQTLLDLMPHLGDVASLDAHIQALRDKYKPEKPA